MTAPFHLEIRDEHCSGPGPHELLVKALKSAISAGTELLLNRGQMPEGFPADETIPGLSGRFSYPMKYGYATVGEVLAAGSQVAGQWEGKRVFAFQPHQSCFIATPNDLIPLPDIISENQALFLANAETAVTLVMDGSPVIGERVAIFGQGVVGLLTTAVLAQFPLADLIAVDTYPLRREMSRALGATQSLDPTELRMLNAEEFYLDQKNRPAGFDLSYELSGSPEALDQAIAATGFSGRVIVGSWYGTKPVTVRLDTHFHRHRIQLISSQVSTIAPLFQGRWTKRRRLDTAIQRLTQIQPERLITHRFPFSQAPEAYQLLDAYPENTVQVVLVYE